MIQVNKSESSSLVKGKDKRLIKLDFPNYIICNYLLFNRVKLTNSILALIVIEVC